MKTAYHTANCRTGEKTSLLKKHSFFCWKIVLLVVACCIVSRLPAHTGVVDIGKSFANISKLSTGGTFEPNDILEVRVTFAVRNVSPSQITGVQVFDTVPSKTTYIPGSIRVTTNEGITYQGPYTDAYDNADPGSCVAGNIQINLGSGAAKNAGGTIKNTDRPSFYGSTCIIVACYRIQINATAHYGDTIKIGGKVIYKISAVTTTRNFPSYGILLAHSFANTCVDGMTVSAASDSLGTFASGTLQSRPAALAFTTTYTKTTIGTGTPNDYSYAIVNNSSADGSINTTSKMPETSPLHRVFGLWDISGDHTGAVNPAIGNPPAAPGSRKGYMVLINSSYNTDIAYKETLSNLCPGTFYEFSAWFRNLCPRCGCDSTGKGSGTSGYIVGSDNDSSGVKPNINFEIDGLAVYTSGDIRYNRVTPWRKFGFVFLTRPSQTTASFLIRNNSPGGGGNDWALDDINVSHCGPNLSMNIKPVVLGCDATPFLVGLSDTVRYLYDNGYVYWQWQKSNVGGTVWTNLAGPGTSGIGLPQVVNGQYEYVAHLPSFLATMADSGIYYRVIVATTPGNLSGSCAYNDGSSTMIKVLHCGTILATNYTGFTGTFSSAAVVLNWSVSDEDELKMYAVEKSRDGINFKSICFVPAGNSSAGNYKFTDRDNITGNIYYRIKMIDNNGLYKYSKIILLSEVLRFEIRNLKNPVSDDINTDVIVPSNGLLHVVIYNGTGMPVKQLQLPVNKGLNSIFIKGSAMPDGIYILSIEFNHEVINRKLMKLN